jgi:hypothetical protein
VFVQHGEPVEYRTVQQGLLLKGEVHIKPGVDAMTGILCQCCHSVVSCSKFEAHAGQGSRRCDPSASVLRPGLLLVLCSAFSTLPDGSLLILLIWLQCLCAPAHLAVFAKGLALSAAVMQRPQDMQEHRGNANKSGRIRKVPTGSMLAW